MDRACASEMAAVNRPVLDCQASSGICPSFTAIGPVARMRLSVSRGPRRRRTPGGSHGKCPRVGFVRRLASKGLHPVHRRRGVGPGSSPSVTTFLSDGMADVSSHGVRRRLGVRAGDAFWFDARTRLTALSDHTVSAAIVQIDTRLARRTTVRQADGIDRVGWRSPAGECACTLTMRLARAHHGPCSPRHPSSCSWPKHWSSADCWIRLRRVSEVPGTVSNSISVRATRSISSPPSCSSSS